MLIDNLVNGLLIFILQLTVKEIFEMKKKTSQDVSLSSKKSLISSKKSTKKNDESKSK